MITVVTAIVSYVAGLLSGFFISKVFHIGDDEKSGQLVLIVVTIIWALSMIIEIVNPAYKTNPFVHTLMGGIVGFFYKPKEKV